MIVTFNGGIITNNTIFQTIPMSSKEACLRAGDSFKENSKNVGIICVGSEKGEVIRIAP